MDPRVPAQGWHVPGWTLAQRMEMMRAVVRWRGWRVLRRPRWLGWVSPRTTVCIHPLRLMVTRRDVDLLDGEDTVAEAVLLAHETCHVIQGRGSRLLWTLRYVFSAGFRRAVEEEAFAHGQALALVLGVRWRYKDPAVLSPKYLLRRDESTAARVLARAQHLLESAQEVSP